MNINIEITSDDQVGFLVDLIKKFVRVNGRDVQAALSDTEVSELAHERWSARRAKRGSDKPDVIVNGVHVPVTTTREGNIKTDSWSSEDGMSGGFIITGIKEDQD